MSLRTALAVLTAAPVRPARPLSPAAASRLTMLAPLGGLLLGLVTGVVVVAIRIWAELPGGQPQSLLPAAGGLALLAMATGGRHLTGLAAVADALATGRRTGRPPTLPDPGADRAGGGLGGAGAAAMLFAVLIQVGALSTAILAHRGTVTILAGCLAITLAGTRAPAGQPASVPARSGFPPAGGAATATDGAAGVGSRIVVGRVSARGAALATAISFALAAIAGRLDYDGGDPSRALRAVIALALATAAGLLLRRFAARRLGAPSEAVLGAVVEVTVLVALVTMAFTIPGWVERLVGA
jgi:adenosylcobinamide-GDP ribazoletransferase